MGGSEPLRCAVCSNPDEPDVSTVASSQGTVVTAEMVQTLCDAIDNDCEMIASSSPIWDAKERMQQALWDSQKAALASPAVRDERVEERLNLAWECLGEIYEADWPDSELTGLQRVQNYAKSTLDKMEALRTDKKVAAAGDECTCYVETTYANGIDESHHVECESCQRRRATPTFCPVATPASILAAEDGGGAGAPIGYVKVEDFIEQGDEYVSMLNDLFALLQDVKAERDAALAAPPSQAGVREVSEDDLAAVKELSLSKIIDALVDRFLAWPLPDSVMPDGDIGHGHRAGDWHKKWGRPLVGTNLLSADEARQMFEHCLREE